MGGIEERRKTGKTPSSEGGGAIDYLKEGKLYRWEGIERGEIRV